MEDGLSNGKFYREASLQTNNTGYNVIVYFIRLDNIRLAKYALKMNIVIEKQNLYMPFDCFFLRSLTFPTLNFMVKQLHSYTYASR